MKKILAILTVFTIMSLNIASVKAIDSGVAGGSSANPESGGMQSGQGLIVNWGYNPILRITAVDKNGKSISNTVDFYTSSNLQGTIYKGYKFGTGKYKSQKDNFFGLTDNDTYENNVIFDKIQYSLEHKTEQEIRSFVRSLGLTDNQIDNRIKDKDLFLVIEPVFIIEDGGGNYISGTSSEIVRYLWKLKNNGQSLWNLHYSGTLELMGKGLRMVSNDIKQITSNGFSSSVITTPAKDDSITSWDQDTANIIQSSSSGYGIVMYYMGDFIKIEKCDASNASKYGKVWINGKCEDPKSTDYSYACQSLSNICYNNEEININGLVSGIDTKNMKNATTASCVYNNPKYQLDQTNSYCVAKITSTTSNILNPLKTVTLGRFVGVKSNPSITVTWECFSPSDSERKDIISSLENYKMPNIKYSYLGSNYTYKNTTIQRMYESSVASAKTDYNSTYYPLTLVLKYNYAYESKYLNKWVNKETGKGSGSTNSKVSGIQYSQNSADINFEVPLDTKFIGKNIVTTTFDTSTSINVASKYLKKYQDNNSAVSKVINGSTVTFHNGDQFLGNKNYICSTEVTVRDNPNVPTNLVYRPIDLSNPFPGSSGVGRNSGANWSEENVKKYITDRQDVYEKKPLYSVTLTPSVIKQIRQYNDKNDYADFNTFLCDENGEHCYSTFLRSENFSNIVDQSRSMCYNINNTTSEQFDKCVDYSNRK